MSKIKEELRLVANRINIANTKDLVMTDEIFYCYKLYNKVLLGITALLLVNYIMVFSFQNELPLSIFMMSLFFTSLLILFLQTGDIRTLIEYAKYIKQSQNKRSGYLFFDIISSSRNVVLVYMLLSISICLISVE